MASTPQQAFDLAGKGETTIGWKLDPDQRAELLQQFPPLFATAVADHVTLRPRSAGDAPLPPDVDGVIVGRAADDGVEAMVVRIDGTTDRPGGGTYHITWSLAESREARESNDVLAARAWQMFDLPMPVRLLPARFP